MITVSPPRTVKEDASSVQPPAHAASSWRSPRSLKRPMILSFSHRKEGQTKSPPSPTVTATPPLPPSMQFPIPPNSQVSSRTSKPSQDDVRIKRETMGSGKSVRITSPTKESFSELPRRTNRAVSQTSRESKEQADQLSPSSALRPVEEVPPPRTPSQLSINTAGHGSLSRQGSLRSPVSATPSRISFRRGSRSPSPAGTPPTAPLPSLPPEAVDTPPPPPPVPSRVSVAPQPAPSSPSTLR